MKNKITLLISMTAFIFYIGINDVSAATCSSKIKRSTYYSTIASATKNYQSLNFVSVQKSIWPTQLGANDEVISSLDNAKEKKVLYWDVDKLSNYEFNINTQRIFRITNGDCEKIDSGNIPSIKYNVTYVNAETRKQEGTGIATVSLTSCKMNDGIDGDVPKDENGPYYARYKETNIKARYPSVYFNVDKNGQLDIFVNGLEYAQFKVTFDTQNSLRKIYSSISDIDNSQTFNLGGGIDYLLTPNNYKYKSLDTSGSSSCVYSLTGQNGDGNNADIHNKVMMFSHNYIGVTFKLPAYVEDGRKWQTNSGGFTLSKEKIYNDKTICSDLWDSTSSGGCGTGKTKNSSNSNKETTAAKFQNDCCVSRTTNLTCGNFHYTCPAGYYSDSSKNNVSVSGAEDAITKCCTNQCKYEPSSFATDASKTRCCAYFKQDNYKNLPSGKTVDNFKDDFPECFNSNNDVLKYTNNNPTCETGKKKTVSYHSYMDQMNLNWYNNQDGWIYLLQNDGVKDSIGMKELLNSKNKPNSYAENSKCYLVCDNSVEINLPGGPNLIAKPGAHIVWPDSNSNELLSSSISNTCRAMTTSVTDETDKNICEAYWNGATNKINVSDYANIALKYYDELGNMDLTTNLKGENASTSLKTDVITISSGRQIKLYTQTKKTNFELARNQSAYSFKNKSLLPSNSGSDYEANINIGHGALPISWNSKAGDKYIVELDYITRDTSLDGEYICEFKIDSPDYGNGCPSKSMYPNQKVDEINECRASGTDIKECINTLCDIYCPSDCEIGTGTCNTDSTNSINYKRCVVNKELSDEECELKYCKVNDDVVVYRTISLSDPFPGINGNGRKQGSNWTDEDKMEIITKKQDVYTKEPMYEITLGPKSIKAIREYNKKATATYGYLDFTLKCTNGKNCRMGDFLSDSTISSIFNTNTCGWSLNWDECEKRWE